MSRYFTFLPLYIMTVFFLHGSGELSSAADSVNFQQSPMSGKETVLEIEDEVLDELSDQEREWYTRFQNGVVFFDGWSSISNEILDIFKEHDAEEKKMLIQRLGIKIGTEWCKDNNTRKINNTMLKSWGEKLRSAMHEGPEAAAEVLSEIEQEVDIILQSKDELSLITSQS